MVPRLSQAPEPELELELEASRASQRRAPEREVSLAFPPLVPVLMRRVRESRAKMRVFPPQALVRVRVRERKLRAWMLVLGRALR